MDKFIRVYTFCLGSLVFLYPKISKLFVFLFIRLLTYLMKVIH